MQDSATAQRVIDTRALEIASETKAMLDGHKREDEIHFGNLRDLFEKGEHRMEKATADIIGAIGTLRDKLDKTRDEESGKRKEMYGGAWRVAIFLIVGLLAMTGSLLAYIWHTHGG